MSDVPRYEQIKSLEQANREQKERYGTLKQTVNDFRHKNRVKVICVVHDFYNWNGEEGHVIKINLKNVFPIMVKFDHPIHVFMPDESIFKMETFSFKPEDLITFKKLKELRRDEEIKGQLETVRSKFFKRKACSS